MGKPKSIEDAPPTEAASGEFGPITVSEWLALPEDVRQRRARRGYERFLALKGKVQIKLDIDEARGRHR